MFSRGGFNAKTRDPKISGSEEALIALAQDNPDKALVMKYIGQLVVDGYAEWDAQDNGEIEVRFTSGETFLLSETSILRIA